MSLRLVVRQVPVPERLELAGKSVLMHGERKIIGGGAALVLTAGGPNRVADLSRAWQEAIATIEISNLTERETPGVIGLTSIAFSGESGYQSSITIPQHTLLIENQMAIEISAEGNQDNQNLVSPTGTFEIGSQSPADFEAGVRTALAAIESNQVEKVVLARDLWLPTSGKPDLSEALELMQQRYPGCWIYAIGQVFGASPELLLRAERGEVSARVLAGTAGRGTDPDVDRAIADGLAHSLKNKHEHRYAVQSLTSELEPFCSSVEADAEPFSLALPDLWHLATDVRGKLLDGVSLLDVIERLHPTAAVAGTPRDKAMELISKIEPFDRGGYAGPVGWLSSDGSGEIAIALRGGVIEPGGIRAIAGCGIVSESEPAAELAETELKFRAIRWAFS